MSTYSSSENIKAKKKKDESRVKQNKLKRLSLREKEGIEMQYNEYRQFNIVL